MCAEFFITKAEFLKDEVRGGEGLNSNEIRQGDMAENEGTERAVIGFPNLMGLGVFGHAQVGQHPLQPSGETQVIGLNSELETPFFPV